jgi:ribosomal protein S18 acetylase RimI-like enzyme
MTVRRCTALVLGLACLLSGHSRYSRVQAAKDSIEGGLERDARSDTSTAAKSSTIRIHQATLDHLTDLVPLFDGYRQFFQQSSDLAGARTFLARRLVQHDAVIFIAYNNSNSGGGHINPSSSSQSGTTTTASSMHPLDTNMLSQDRNDTSTSTPVGFVLLYGLFLSVSMKQVWMLEDLYVAPAARKLGVAQALLERAEALSEATGADYVSLETATSNVAAQSLFEGRHWERDDEFYTYYYETSTSSKATMPR